ncbi:MAG: Smr/MutS family protein [Spirochaetia bacterium]|jgi:DNA mismatch repair protein MutS2|nr:Smr/MutS family protein [Spirochaetia bacterium]
MTVSKKTLEDLGFPQVRQMIASHCLTCEGKARLGFDDFIGDRTLLLERQHIVDRLRALLQRPHTEKPEAFPSLEPVLEEFDRTYQSLDGICLLASAEYVDSSRKLLDFLCLDESEPSLGSSLSEHLIPELLQYAEKATQVLDGDGKVKESYPSIRKLLEAADASRHSRTDYARKFIKGHVDAMRDQPETVRDGRLVLPVRSDAKSRVDGFVHSASASGNTIFMEPYKLVEYNNQVVLAEQQVQIEIARILSELSQQLKSLETELRVLSSVVTQIDCLYAMAVWSVDQHCTQTLLEEAPSPVRLLKARHPLLGQKAVPITIDLKENIRAVVLSGPNAGGKTVTIKTVGLFVLLNQLTGFIPCSEGSALPLFSGLYTDIGDEQSISDELSTFSGHMHNLAQILRGCTDSSLVILDELGSGTDPAEGGAIACGVLDYLAVHAGLSLITSHQVSLKHKAYISPSMMNASMEFNEDSHLPTFNVIQGLPGDSHALDTAIRMKLPDEVIEAARRYLGSDNLQMGKIIKELESRQREAAWKAKELEERERQLSELRRQIDLHELQVRQKEHMLKVSQSTELSRYVRESRSRLEKLVSDVATGKLTKEKTQAVKTFIADIGEKQADFSDQLDKEETELHARNMKGSKPVLSVGCHVLCGSLKKEGIILSAAGRDKWEVGIGSMRITLKEKDLEPIDKQEPQSQKVNVSYLSSSPRPKLCIDVRGLTLEQALDALQRQIEACMVHGLSSFQVIHGLGNGILQTGITRYLKQDQNIKDFHFAKPDDGGMGKTYVEL